MNSHDNPGVWRRCRACLAAPCNARPIGRRPQPASLTCASTAGRGHPRARCAGLRTPPGYVAELGSCWYRRYPWSAVTWRLDDPLR